MKAGWEIKQLKELCSNFKNDIVDGPFGANLKREDYVDSGIPVLKIQNIKPNVITLKKMDYVGEEKYEELKRHSYKSGDIIMTKLGDPLGACAIVDGISDGLIVADLVRIRAQKINTRYLCYHLNSPLTNDFINTKQQGATRPRVQISAVRELPIFVPSLAEQERIVAMLDEAFAGIETATENAKKNLQNARELFESHLQSIFTTKGAGWVEKKLSELMEITHGYAFKGEDFGVDEDVSKPIVLTPGNYGEDGELIFTLKNTKRYNGDIPKHFLFNEGDLTIVMTDLSSKMKILGKPAFITKSGILHNQRIGRILFKGTELSQRFAYYYLRTNLFTDHIKSTATGTMVRHTAPTRILTQRVSFPSLSEQQRIVTQLDTIATETKRLEAIYQQKLGNLAALKQSILQKAFAGELHTDRLAA